MRERRGNGSQPQAKYCSGASTGLFLDHRAFLGNRPSPGEAEGGCLQLPGWEELGVAKGLLRRQLGSSREDTA